MVTPLQKPNVGEEFCGLAIDEENQDELTDERIDAWVAK